MLKVRLLKNGNVVWVSPKSTLCPLLHCDLPSVTLPLPFPQSLMVKQICVVVCDGQSRAFIHTNEKGIYSYILLKIVVPEYSVLSLPCL